MVDVKQAIDIAKTEYPDGDIKLGPVTYNNFWMFSIYGEGPEGELNTFYSVDKNTGEFRDASRIDDISGLLDAFSNLESPETLIHFGKKGMKWGVRKDAKTTGPSSGSVKAEAILNVAKATPLRMFIPAANLKNRAIRIAADVLQASGNVAMSSIVKSNLIGPQAIVGYILSAADSGAYRVPGVLAKNAIKGGWNKDPKLADPNMSLADISKKVVKPINSDYPGLGTTNNCLRASYAYEMRRRGFDVAATKTLLATGQTKSGQRLMSGIKNADHWVKDLDPDRSKTSRFLLGEKPRGKDIFKALSNEPDRSRGEFQMSWGLLVGGHSISYEIINKSPVFIDNQNGKIYKTPSELDVLAQNARNANYTRLDNKNLNRLALPAWIKDA